MLYTWVDRERGVLSYNPKDADVFDVLDESVSMGISEDGYIILNEKISRYESNKFFLLGFYALDKKGRKNAIRYLPDNAEDENWSLKMKLFKDGFLGLNMDEQKKILDRISNQNLKGFYGKVMERRKNFKQNRQAE